MTATLCRDCDHVAEHTRKQPQHQWLCVMHKRVEGGSFVDPKWKNDPPYLFCKNLNGGACPLYQPRLEKE